MFPPETQMANCVMLLFSLVTVRGESKGGAWGETGRWPTAGNPHKLPVASSSGDGVRRAPPPPSLP